MQTLSAEQKKLVNTQFIGNSGEFTDLQLNLILYDERFIGEYEWLHQTGWNSWVPCFAFQN